MNTATPAGRLPPPSPRVGVGVVHTVKYYDMGEMRGFIGVQIEISIEISIGAFVGRQGASTSYILN